MNIRVVICDDVAELRNLYRVWLSAEADIDLVGEATNGAEAVALTESLHPDIILLDVQMPEKDGMQALAEITDHHPDTKVIMLSGLDASLLADEAAELGAADYMEKGSDLHTMVDRIRAVHDRDR